MKTILTWIFLSISLSSFSQLRNTEWGMNSEEVKKLESSKLIRESNGDLNYSVEINDLYCNLDYIFANNKLIEIKYSFIPIVQDRTSSNPSAIWVKTISNIREKYGEPTSRDNEKLYIWSLKDFSIKAANESRSANERVTVSYTPPSPSQKDIL